MKSRKITIRAREYNVERLAHQQASFIELTARKPRTSGRGGSADPVVVFFTFEKNHTLTAQRLLPSETVLPLKYTQIQLLKWNGYITIRSLTKATVVKPRYINSLRTVV